MPRVEDAGTDKKVFVYIVNRSFNWLFMSLGNKLCVLLRAYGDYSDLAVILALHGATEQHTVAAFQSTVALRQPITRYNNIPDRSTVRQLAFIGQVYFWPCDYFLAFGQVCY